MNNITRNLPFLDVPYFQQTRSATCGPACLMMVMKYWKPSIEFSRRFEIQLWRKSYSLFLFGGTFQFGLAAAATTLGFQTELYQKLRFSDGYPRFPQLVRLVESIVSNKSRRLHIPIRYGQENLAVISEALQQSIPAIVFINLHPILGENVFHWVVVTGLDEQKVYINDPYVPRGFDGQQKKNYPIPLDVFSQAMKTEVGRNLRLPPCVVLVHP
jgi:ABC-type bacteriocin/lantibiotic exporter with double-glycine peptidase domain